jgi:hypothetical protein
VPDIWGAALVLAVLELDGTAPPVAAFARSFGCTPSSVRSVLAKLRRFLATLDREFAMRAFAARANPRIADPPVTAPRKVRPADIVPFPTP